MDLEIKEIPTAARTTPENLKFIQTWIGRIFNYGVFNDIDMSRLVSTNSTPIIDRLVKDLEAAALFARTSSFWKNMQFVANEDKDNSISGNVSDLLDSSHGQILTYSETWPTIDDSSNDVIITRTINYSNSPTLYIFYNTIYNLSLVVDLFDAKSVCDSFPDFVIVQELTFDISDSVKMSLNSIFHKKSFSSIDEINTKFDAFSSLFNIGKTQNKTNKGDEKTRIEKFILENYTISNDPDKRIKANDLYKTVINHMCVHYNDVTTFKKRLAGYLVDMCLKKKRFSDAYYFYGIDKNNVDFKSFNAALEERLKTYKINKVVDASFKNSELEERLNTYKVGCREIAAL